MGNSCGSRSGSGFLTMVVFTGELGSTKVQLVASWRLAAAQSLCVTLSAEKVILAAVCL